MDVDDDDFDDLCVPSFLPFELEGEGVSQSSVVTGVVTYGRTVATNERGARLPAVHTAIVAYVLGQRRQRRHYGRVVYCVSTDHLENTGMGGRPVHFYLVPSVPAPT
jgi:hypothetical protein